MEQTARRAGSGGPAFVRLLARLTDATLPDSGQSLSDRLSLWLAWTDAIALSAVIEGQPVVTAGGASDAAAAARDCARLRADLTGAIVHDAVFSPPKAAAGPRHARAAAPVEADPAYGTYRQRYLALQQTMETGIGNLRSRLRGMLAARTPGLGRLALMDAVMERSLGARERSLLAAVPRLMERHFEQLRQAGEADADPAAAPLATPPWLHTFRTHMQHVLLAELDVRLQPVEGLLAALQDR